MQSFESAWPGDEATFHAVFVAHFQGLCDAAYLYVRSRDMAQDIVQDVFCRMWEQRATLVIRRSILAYLHTAVRHQAFDTLRHRRTVQRVEEAEFDDEYPGLGMPSAWPDHAVLAAEQWTILEVAIAALPERQRLVWRLRCQDELAYTEIAAYMKSSVKGVEALRRRAVLSLQHSLRHLI